MGKKYYSEKTKFIFRVEIVKFFLLKQFDEKIYAPS
jgi:hypothetical protein